MATIAKEDLPVGITFKDFAKSSEFTSDLLVFDVTENPSLLENARRLVSSSYARLSTQKPSPEDVYQELCRDGYDNHGRSRTIGVFGRQAENVALLGTVRLVLGSDVNENELYPLDAMGLVEASWPHRMEEVSDSRVGELGRFVIDNDFREDKIKKRVTRMLYDEARKIGLERAGIKTLYALMPSYVVELTTASGILSKEVEGSRLRWEDPKARAIFEKYDIYWQKLNPKPYQFLTE